MPLGECQIEGEFQMGELSLICFPLLLLLLHISLRLILKILLFNSFAKISAELGVNSLGICFESIFLSSKHLFLGLSSCSWQTG